MPDPNVYYHSTPIVLCGLKRDLREDATTIERLRDRGMRPITTEQGQAMAKEIGAVAYCENRYEDSNRYLNDALTIRASVP